MRSCSVAFYSLQPYGLQPARLLCPWRFSRFLYGSLKSLLSQFQKEKRHRLYFFSNYQHHPLSLTLHWEKTKLLPSVLTYSGSDFWIDELSLLLSKVKPTNDDPHIFPVLKYKKFFKYSHMLSLSDIINFPYSPDIGLLYVLLLKWNFPWLFSTLLVTYPRLTTEISTSSLV